MKLIRHLILCPRFGFKEGLDINLFLRPRIIGQFTGLLYMRSQEGIVHDESVVPALDACSKLRFVSLWEIITFLIYYENNKNYCLKFLYSLHQQLYHVLNNTFIRTDCKELSIIVYKRQKLNFFKSRLPNFSN